MVPEYIPDAESQAAIRENIRAKTYESALPAIEKGVDDAVSAVRDNKEGGFWGFLKSMIFKIAAFFNFEKTLAKWFGSPIPEKEEQRAVAAQVSDTVSQTLTDPDFKYANKQEFETGLSTRIQNDLKANRANMPSFSDEQFAEVANKAAKAASDQMLTLGLFDNEGKVVGENMYLSPVDTIAKQKVKDSLESLTDADKKNLALLSGTKEFGDTQIDALSTVLRTKMADLENRKDALKARGADAYATVAGELRATLIDGKGYLSTGGGMNTDDAKLTILADEISKSFVRNQLGVTESPTQAFVIASEKRKQELINTTVRTEIAGKVKSAITQQTAQGVYESWQDSWWTAPAYPNDVYALDGYYDKDTANPKKYNRKKNPDDKDGKLAAGEEALFQFADGKGKGLSSKQRDKVSAIVAETVEEVINDERAKPLFANKELLAGMIEARLTTKLQKDEWLDKLGTPLATIEANLERPKGSMISDIAGGFAQAIRTNEDGAFDQLSAAQAQLYDSKVLVSRSTASAERTVATELGISGGDQAARDETNRRANVAANNNAGRDSEQPVITTN